MERTLRGQLVDWKEKVDRAHVKYTDDINRLISKAEDLQNENDRLQETAAKESVKLRAAEARISSLLVDRQTLSNQLEKAAERTVNSVCCNVQPNTVKLINGMTDEQVGEAIKGFGERPLQKMLAHIDYLRERQNIKHRRDALTEFHGSHELLRIRVAELEEKLKEYEGIESRRLPYSNAVVETPRSGRRQREVINLVDKVSTDSIARINSKKGSTALHNFINGLEDAGLPRGASRRRYELMSDLCEGVDNEQLERIVKNPFSTSNQPLQELIDRGKDAADKGAVMEAFLNRAGIMVVFD